MRDIREAWAQFSDGHGSEHPIWDRDQLHQFLADERPDWMHLDSPEFAELIGEAIDEEMAELEEEPATAH